MVAVLDKWKLYSHPLIDWKPNPAQATIAQSNARHKVVAGGRRLGKDYYAGTDKLLPEVFFTRPIASTLLDRGKKRIFWIVGPSYQESEKTFRVIWNWCRRLEIPMEKGSFNSPETGLMQIKLWGGALEIIAKSAQVPERLVGEGLSGVIMCEAAKMRNIIWPKYIQPTLADFDGWSYFGSTPEGKNWFYELWRHAQDPYNTEWQSWRMPSWVNYHVYKTPTREDHVHKLLEQVRRTRNSAHKLAKEQSLVIDKEILNRIADLPEELFLQEIAADFTEFVGRVFKEFDEEVHVTDLQYNPGWETYAAVDYGFNNPNVWLLIQVGKWGEINVLDEIYESGLDPEDFADEIRYRGLNPSNLKYIYPDPADPGSTKILEKKLNVRARGGTGGELRNRLNWIRKFLREPRVVVDEPYVEVSLDGLTVGQYRPRLMFDRKCKKTIEDMLAYRYPDKNDMREPGSDRADKPLKDHDHGPEALGRFCAGYFGTFGKNGTRIHTATFSRDDEQAKVEVPRDWYKSEEFRRPAAHERRRTQFPKVNNALSNFLNGVYDDA
ncbi:terminase [Mycobacterium phage Send513]|uniref:Terminase n=2 Tax=Papyrusvirus send513 TaxID=1982556 RepID=G1BRI2_9CAUD|nr:terminase [Mycobacterium phage Send513]AEK07450.1 terminase [Mycobacterium phage Send513]AYQ98579.1 terminase [Mycobacterium phage Riparian]